jgi:hypothetical protein
VPYEYKLPQPLYLESISAFFMVHLCHPRSFSHQKSYVLFILPELYIVHTTPTIIELVEPESSTLLVPKPTITGHDPVYETGHSFLLRTHHSSTEHTFCMHTGKITLLHQKYQHHETIQFNSNTGVPCITRLIRSEKSLHKVNWF